MPFKDSWFGKAIWKVGDTIKGKTKVGQAAHHVLPFKKARSAIGELIKGSKAVAPIPEIKSPEIRQGVEEAIPKLRDAKDDEKLEKEDLKQVIGDVLDLVDDGKVNASKDYDDLSPAWKKRINVGWQLIAFGYIAYEVYRNNEAILTYLGF